MAALSRRNSAQLGGMKLLAQIALQLRRALAEAHGTQPSFRRRDQHAPERGRSNCERDGCARASAAIRAGSHAELLIRFFVKTAGRAEARVVQCGSHIFSFAQSGFDVLHAASGLIFPRAETGGALEQPLQVKRAETDSLAELCQRDHAFGVVEQVPRPQHILRLLGNLRWLAAQTRAITGALGLAWPGKEFH